MCDSFRRLCLPARQWKFQILRLGMMTDIDQCTELVSEMASLPLCCAGYPFVQTLLAHCFVGGEIDLARVQQVRDLLQDALYHIPASSVNVEKLHACTQRNAACLKSGRTAEVVQQNSYVMSAVLEHSRLKKAVEDECLGTTKVRAGRLLRARVAKQTLPAQATTRRKARSTRSVL